MFGDLPDALIRELLARAERISDQARASVDDQVRQRESLRDRAVSLGLVHRLPETIENRIQSVAAVDGSIASHRLAAFDLNVAAALRVDGIGHVASDGECRAVLDPHMIAAHRYSREMIYALMFCMEYEMADSAPEKLVMLDGAFSTGMIGISLGLKSAVQGRDELSQALFNRWIDHTRETVPRILTSSSIVALPKWSPTNEFARLFHDHWPQSETSGRSIASLILDADEYTDLFRLETHGFSVDDQVFGPNYRRDIQARFEAVRVVYFKPHNWSHAYRIEMPSEIAEDAQRMHAVLDAIRRQTTNPAMLEPYPLYVADRFAKSLSKGVNALLDTVRRDVVSSSDAPELAYSMLNSYRTDLVGSEIEE